MLSAVVVALSLSAPTSAITGYERPSAPILEEAPTKVALAAPVQPLETQNLDVDPNAPDHEPSFIEKYLTFQVTSQGSKQVKDGLVLGHVLGYLFWGICGGLWGPVVAVTDSEFSGDVVLTWFVSSILWSLISTAAAFTGIGALMFFALPYLQSTATFNEIDRSIKKRGLSADDPKRPPPQPQPGTPNPGETPPPSYAY